MGWNITVRTGFHKLAEKDFIALTDMYTEKYADRCTEKKIGSYFANYIISDSDLQNEIMNDGEAVYVIYTFAVISDD